MKKRFALGLMLATLIPTCLLAQSNGSELVKKEPPLPVTLDFSLPAESQWLAKVNANPTLSTTAPVGSKALTANVVSPITADQPPAALLPAQPTVPPASSAHAALAYNGAGCDNGCGGDRCNNGLVTPTDFGLTDRVVSRIFGPTGPVREWLRDFCPNVFKAGTISVEYGTQYWRSPIWVASANSTTMLPQVVRLGYMLNDPSQERRLKGAWEVLGEFEAIPILSGAGTIMVGGSGLIRYHQARNHRLVPYYQIGFGGLYTDSAGLAGSPTTTNFNFITQVGFGSHIFLGQTGKWAIVNESSYTFIGNWGIGQGPGYHVLGGLVGITRYFGPGSVRTN